MVKFTPDMLAVPDKPVSEAIGFKRPSRVRIENPERGGTARVLVNGIDLSCDIATVDIHIEGGTHPTATIVFMNFDVAIDAKQAPGMDA